MPDIKDDEKSDLRSQDAREKGGHPRHFPGDMTGQRPESPVFTGQMAPRLAGDRAKAQVVVDGIKSFIEEYGDLAYERSAEGGEVTLPKERVLKLVDALPKMPSSQMMQAVRAIGNYIWRVHAGFRQVARGNKRAMLDKMADLPRDQRRAAAKDILDTIENFDTASVQVKGNLNLLAAAAGELQRSTGGGSKADKTFLKKVGGGFGKPADVKPAEPTAKLGPELAAQAAYTPELTRAERDAIAQAQRAGGEKVRKGQPRAAKAVPPMVRKAPKIAQLGKSSEEMPDDLKRALGIIP